ncbi:hypothetical protein QTP70_017050, partial [Hemibagrus guttatus]
GVWGLYKGMGAPLAGVAPMMAVSFFGFGLGKQLLQSDASVPITSTHTFMAGMLAGVFTTVIVAPGERIKCLLQVQSTSGQLKYTGPMDCAVKLYKQQGIRSVYKGTVLTLIRDVPSTGFYFLTYENLKHFLTPEGQRFVEVTLLTAVSSGSVSSGSLILVVYRKKDQLMLQMFMGLEEKEAADGRYSGLVDVLRTLLREEGARALYKGLSAVMLRAFPANAACFLGFEVALKCLNWLAPTW